MDLIINTSFIKKDYVRRSIRYDTSGFWGAFISQTTYKDIYDCEIILIYIIRYTVVKISLIQALNFILHFGHINDIICTKFHIFA